ncbi:MAG: peptidoglycan DD-metalloendopeptidase family protein [Ruminococcus sp.]|nr:peptidoglycan DD-metalloendopeptidase family protein [Ruminococcus sp.]
MKKFFAAILCVLTVWMSVAYAGSATTAKAATQQELQDRINQIDGEIKQNKDKLNELADKKEKQQEYLDTLENQIDANKDKVNALETQVSSIDNEISGYDTQLKKLKNEITVIEDGIKATNAQITETTDNIDASKDLLAQKLRTAYIQGNDSTLKILMGSKNLAQFLTSLELMKRMSEDDKRVINKFKEQVTSLKKAKDELETKQTSLTDKQTEVEAVKAKSVAKKKELVAKQNEYDTAQKQLEKNYASVESYVAELDKNSAAYKSYIQKLSAEREAADKEIDRILQAYYASLTTTTTKPNETLPSANNHASTASTQATTSPPHNTGESWVWPLGGASCYISSPYGNRNPSVSGWGFHGGIDIAGGGILGKPIYAARSGTVITATVVTNEPYGAKGRGYANYVLIDHGDGYATLYGHCWQVNVRSGQTVSKGQQIATVGSTGNSTGPHLHFEVRHNGAKQNPLNYVKH